MSGFLTDPDEQSSPNVPTNPNLKEQPYQGISVDTKYTSRKTLLTHIGGYRWVIDYFSQMIGKDDETAAQEIERPEVYQQYLNIRELEVRVQDPLRASQDSTSREFTYSGSALLYAGIIPNKGDMFIADIGDGRSGLFVVDDVEQRSIFRDSTYSMSYSLKNYLTETTHSDLMDKVVKVTHFHKDFLALGRNPLLVEEEHQIAKSLHGYLETLPHEYIQQFYNANHSTLIVPGQDTDTYDPFIVKFMMGRVSLDDHPKVLDMRVLNIQDGANSGIQTLWDAIHLDQPRVINLAKANMGVFYANKGYQLAGWDSFRLSGIDHLVFPTGVITGIADELKGVAIKATPAPEYNRPVELYALITNMDLLGLPASVTEPMPLIKPVTVDEFYVLSEAFYREETENMSVLELLVWSALNNETISLKALGKLLDQYYYWPALEKFYYIPLLVYLMRSSFKEIN